MTPSSQPVWLLGTRYDVAGREGEQVGAATAMQLSPNNKGFACNTLTALEWAVRRRLSMPRATTSRRASGARTDAGFLRWVR